jgi:hypothetical protein
MTRAINNPLNGSVVLRGVKIDLDTDIGTGFTLDCTRHIEGLITAEQLKAKYQLSEEAWRQLADNEPLQQAVERQKERRIATGDTVRERARHLFLTTPAVLDSIVNDSTLSPRHRVDACRELRAIATSGSESTPATGDRFIIRIDLTAGGNKDDVILIDQPLTRIESGEPKKG